MLTHDEYIHMIRILWLVNKFFRESEIDEMDNDTFKMTFEFDVEEEKFELIQVSL